MRIIIALLIVPAIALAQSPYEQGILDNQRQIIQLQQQQVNIVQQAQSDQFIAQLRDSKSKEAEVWAWFNALPKIKKKEIIDEWNTDRPDCAFPCLSHKSK